MSEPWRRRWRRLRFAIGALLATVLIALAAAMALGQLLLPLLQHHPQQVAQLLSWRLHEPVTLATVRGQWQPSGPLLSATGLRIGRGAQALSLPTAQLKINFGAWLRPDTRWLELRVTGLQADVRRDASGAWRLSGLVDHGQQAAPQSLSDLPVGLLLRDISLNIHMAGRAQPVRLHAAVLRAISEHGVLRVAGRVSRGSGGAQLTVAARFDAPQHAARLYVAGENVDLAAWSRALGLHGARVTSGRLEHVRLWLRWGDGALRGVHADLGVSDLDLKLAHGDQAQMPAWRGRVQAQQDAAGGWRAAVVLAGARDAAASGGRIDLRWHAGANGDVRLDAQARDLDIARLAPWLALLPSLRTGEQGWLREAAPHGYVDHLRLDWRDPAHFRLQAQMHAVGFAAAGAMPGIQGLTGVLRGDAQGFALELPAQALTIALPQIFRKPFDLTRVAGTLALWRHGDGWRFGLPDLSIKGEGFALRARGQVSVAPDSSPLVDLSAVIEHAKVPAAKAFWPIHTMPPATVAWLDRALVAGTITQARVLLRGHLDDWPFAHHQGRFEAVATLRNMTLDYAPDWPRAQGISAKLRFVDVGMDVRADAASVLGNTIDHAHATIADLAQAPLVLKVAAHGDAGKLLQFMRTSPLGARWNDALSGMHFDGPAKLALELAMPLHGEAQGPSVDGTARLEDVGFAAPAWSLKLDHVKGAVNFTALGFTADSLAARYRGQPVALHIAVGNTVADPAHQLEASMDGRLDVAALLATHPSLHGLGGVSRGSADFRIGLVIDDAGAGAAGTPHLSLDSDLRGVALDLPAPLHKPAAVAWPLHLQVDFPFAGAALTVTLGDVLDARARLPAPGTPLAADIALGGPAQAPPARGVVIHGHAEHLDASGWIQRALAAAPASTGAGPADAGLREVDVVARHMAVYGRSFDNLALRLLPGDDKTTVTLVGKQLAGTISVPASGLARRGITARLDRLYWPDAQSEASAANAAPAASASAPAPATNALAPSLVAGTAAHAIGVAPASVPPLHIWVGDLRLGDARLGETRFESYPTAEGMRIEHLETHSPDVQMGARGDWTGSADASHTHLVIDFSSPDLGRMLDAFGYPGLVAGGATLAHIDGTWPGAPTAFSLADLNGTMKVSVTDGSILNVEPGVGRLFGLLSIRELPRRLSLDFGDMFRSGFSFNSITGHFTFADGNARTDDLTIRGPSAIVQVRGRTGLRQHDYDQIVDVTPHVGGALPLVGAIAGGPVGAAAGLAVQSLIGRGLGRAARVRYRITGSWEHPQITEIAHPLVPPRSAPPRPAPGTSVSTAPPPPAAHSAAPPAPATTVSRARL